MFNNKIEKFSIRKTKIAVASVLTGLFLFNSAVIQNNVPLLEPTIVYADESREISLTKYKITANVDVNNDIPEGTNPEGKLATSVVSITIPDTTGIKSGDYLTYEVDNMAYQSNNFVMVNGVHVGRLVRVSKIDYASLLKSDNPDEYNKVQDGFSGSNAKAMWRIIFNDNIETLASASLEVKNIGSVGFGSLADHDRIESFSIKDSQGAILSSKKVFLPNQGGQDDTSTVTPKDLNNFIVGSAYHSLNSRSTSLHFAVNGIQSSKDKEKYKAGTTISFNYKPNEYITPKMTSLYSGDSKEPLKVGSIVTVKDIDTNPNIIGISQQISMDIF